MAAQAARGSAPGWPDPLETPGNKNADRHSLPVRSSRKGKNHMVTLDDLRHLGVRDCILAIAEEGLRCNDHEEALRCIHGITVELRRLGFGMDEVQEFIKGRNQHWEHQIEDFNKRIGLVGWLYKKDLTPITCNRRTNHRFHFCDRKPHECKFYTAVRNNWNNDVSSGQIDAFGKTGWPAYLEKKYRHRGYLASEFVFALERILMEKNLPKDSNLYVGLRTLVEVINNKFKKSIIHHHQELCCILHILEEEGLVSITRGSPVRRHRKANCYRLPGKFPSVPTSPILGYMGLIPGQVKAKGSSGAKNAK